MDEYLKSKKFYNQACGIKKIEDDIKLIKKKLKFKNDIPLAFVGLLNELCFEKPQYYWKRDVAKEVYELLNEFALTDSELFVKAFEISSIEFFESIRAYESITKIISEIRNVAFEQSFKTRIFRNPIFAQICEDLLMNLYRVLRNIVNQFSEKDYSNQNTLTPIIQCLNKNGFSKSTDININLRNAVNHGNVFVNGNKINYRFGKSHDYKSETIDYWVYDDLIDETYDIACGVLVGMLQILSLNPIIIEQHADTSEENALEWFKLMYKNDKVKILDITKGKINTSQLNINIETSIDNKDHLVVALIELAKGAFVLFPEYDRYLVGYNHNRSTTGFLRFTNSQLSQTSEVPELYKVAIESKDILMFDIMDSEINENAYKYHVFPKIKTKDYEVLDTQDCSIINFKRIKANLILSERMSKKKIKSIISKVTFELAKFKTPQNPHEETAWGKEQADIVLLNVFINNPNRKKFNLFPENTSFVGLAHYYKNESCPRLKNGGLMENLWKSYKQEKLKNNIMIAWNPKYKTPLPNILYRS